MSLRRVLSVGLEDALEMFIRFKWKFYEVDGDDIVMEIPRNNDTLIVKIPFNQENETRLQNEGFIHQTREYK